jgi:HEPN domain-containing protein
MADPKLTHEWLQKADEDWGFAASVIADSPYFAQTCFHFHQAIRDTVKSLLKRPS